MKIEKKLYLLLFVVITGFILLISVNYYFMNLSKKVDKKVLNQQNKLLISSFISDDLNIIEAQFFQLAINGRNIRSIANIEKRIKNSIDNIMDSPMVLKDGGTLRRVVKLNIVGHNSMMKVVKYKKQKSEVSLVAIDILPKIIGLHRMVADVDRLLRLRIKYKNNQSKLLSVRRKIIRYYKTAPAYFQRVSENINRSIYEGDILLNKIQKIVDTKKERYLVTQFSIIISILFFVIFLIVLIMQNIKQSSKKLLKLNENLKHKDAEIKTIINSQSSMVIVSTNRKIIYANQTLIDFFSDYNDISEFINENRCICDFFEEDIPDDSYIYNKDYDGKDWIEYILANPNKNFKAIMQKENAKHHFSIYIKKRYIKSDDPTIVITLNDITEQIQNHNLLLEQKIELHHQANYDLLTNLPNRTLLFDRLDFISQKAKRNKFKFAVLFIDLDNFKEINDSLGHDVGDEVLKIVSERLKSFLRSGDIISRLGGDEFVIVLEDLNQIQDASIVAKNIIELLSNDILIRDYVLYANCSIGISIFPDDSLDIHNLLKFSDSAMYVAKRSGKGQFRYYNSKMTQLAFKKIALEADLKNAIKNSEFTVYFQPQVDATTGDTIGAESLVRWIHPTKGIISPNDFIPFAESSGLILKIDEFVMKSSMEQFSKWYKEGLNPGVLSMNLSAKHLREKDFIKKFKTLVAQTKCEPKWLELEITERQIMNDPNGSIAKLQELRNLGTKIAIDDFGTGYSSLAYLQNLPIDKLKIDISFIRKLPDDKNSVALTKTIISLAKNLNLTLLAEGVENREQKDFLVLNGCKNIQGYYYSKPQEAKEFIKFCI